MTCQVPHCANEATGTWQWTRSGYSYPMCEPCWRLKRRGRAPGTFTPFEAVA